MTESVLELMKERNNQPGKWSVVIDRGEATNIVIQCVNRPAISFGEDMIRIADLETEQWFPRRGIEGIDVQMQAKKSMLELVDQIGPDNLRTYAQRLKSTADTETDFMVASVLDSAVDMYEAVGEFLMEGSN